ncbi:MAG: DUF481 domain-containing protein [Candidatus Neomarinimicrobiota bacterium]
MLLLACPLVAQVNTEAMRKSALMPGLNGNLSLELGLVGGNSQLLNAKGILRLDYIGGRTHTFLVGNRQESRAKRSRVINKGFIHLRHTRPVRGRTFVEGFLQSEFDEFIRLKDRDLAGGGVRFRWRDTMTDNGAGAGQNVTTGLGFMWERERITNPKDSADAEKNLLRSTNYLILGWRPDDRLLLQVTTYIQFDVQQLDDFRVLLDAGLSFTLAGQLSATISLGARYDSRPPAMLELDRHDFELTSGLAYAL